MLAIGLFGWLVGGTPSGVPSAIAQPPATKSAPSTKPSLTTPKPEQPDNAAETQAAAGAKKNSAFLGPAGRQLSLQELFVPADRLDEFLPADEIAHHLDVESLRKLLDSYAQNLEADATRIPSACYLTASVDLQNKRLIGSGIWRFPAEPGNKAQLDPWNLSILSLKVGDKATNEYGVSPEGHLFVGLGTANELSLRWELFPHTAKGAWSFNLQVPNCGVSVLDLTVPAGWTVRSPARIRVEEKPNQVRLFFAGQDSLAIELVPPEAPQRDRGVLTWRDEQIFRVGESGIEMEVLLQFESLHEPVDRVQFLVDKEVRPRDMQSSTPARWTWEETPGGQIRWTAEFRRPPLGPFRLSFRSSLPTITDVLWFPPVVSVEDGIARGTRLLFWISPSLRMASMYEGNYRLTQGQMLSTSLPRDTQGPQGAYQLEFVAPGGASSIGNRSLLREEDLLDPINIGRRLSDALRKGNSPALRRLYEMLPNEGRVVLRELSQGRIKPESKIMLAEFLNRLVRTLDLYQAKDFAGVNFDSELKALIARPSEDLSIAELYRRNRRILETLFPKELARSQPLTPGFRLLDDQPEVDVSQQSFLDLSGEQARSLSVIQWTPMRGTLYQPTVRIPAGWEPVRVEVEPPELLVSQHTTAAEAGSSLLSLVLKEGLTQGNKLKAMISIEPQRRLALPVDDALDFKLPEVIPEDFRPTGVSTYTVLLGDAVTVEMRELPPALDRAIPYPQSPAPKASEQYSFQYASPLRSGTVRLLPRSAKYRAQLRQTWQWDGKSWTARLLVEFEGDPLPNRSLVLRSSLPLGDKWEWKRLGSGAGVRVVPTSGEPANKVAGKFADYAIELDGPPGKVLQIQGSRRESEPQIAVPLIEIPGADSFTATLAVNSPSGAVVDVTSEGLSESPLESSDDFWGNGTVWLSKYSRLSTEASVKLTASVPTPLPAGTVRKATTPPSRGTLLSTSVVYPNEVVSTDRYSLENELPQSVELVVPPRAELWEVLLDGKSVGVTIGDDRRLAVAESLPAGKHLLQLRWTQPRGPESQRWSWWDGQLWPTIEQRVLVVNWPMVSAAWKIETPFPAFIWQPSPNLSATEVGPNEWQFSVAPLGSENQWQVTLIPVEWLERLLNLTAVLLAAGIFWGMRKWSKGGVRWALVGALMTALLIEWMAVQPLREAITIAAWTPVLVLAALLALRPRTKPRSAVSDSRVGITAVWGNEGSSRVQLTSNPSESKGSGRGSGTRLSGQHPLGMLLLALFLLTSGRVWADEPGDGENPVVPSEQSWRRVLVPYDPARPEAPVSARIITDRLKRTLEEVKDYTPWSVLVLKADYEGKIVAPDLIEWKGRLDLVVDLNEKEKLPVSLAFSEIDPQEMQLGGREIPFLPAGEHSRLDFDLTRSGRQELEITFYTPILGTAEIPEVDFGVPPCPDTRVRLDVGPEMVTVVSPINTTDERSERSGANFRWQVATKSGRVWIQGNLGLTRRVSLRWQAETGGKTGGAKVSVQSYQLLDLQLETRDIAANFEFQIADGSTEYLRFEIPATLALRRVEAPGLTNWWFAQLPSKRTSVPVAVANRELVLQFDSPRSGPLLVRIFAHVPASRLARIAVPRIVPAGVDQETATIGVRMPDGWQVEPTDPTVIEPVLGSTFLREWKRLGEIAPRSIALAGIYRSRDARLTLQLDTPQSRIDVTQNFDVIPDPESLFAEVKGEIVANVQGESARRLTVRLPASLELLRLQGDNLYQWSPLGREVTLLPKMPVEGEFKLQIVGRLPLARTGKTPAAHPQLTLESLTWQDVSEQKTTWKVRTPRGWRASTQPSDKVTIKENKPDEPLVLATNIGGVRADVELIPDTRILAESSTMVVTVQEGQMHLHGRIDVRFNQSGATVLRFEAPASLGKITWLSTPFSAVDPKQNKPKAEPKGMQSWSFTVPAGISGIRDFQWHATMPIVPWQEVTLSGIELIGSPPADTFLVLPAREDARLEITGSDHINLMPGMLTEHLSRWPSASLSRDLHRRSRVFRTESADWRMLVRYALGTPQDTAGIRQLGVDVTVLADGRWQGISSWEILPGHLPSLSVSIPDGYEVDGVVMDGEKLTGAEHRDGAVWLAVFRKTYAQQLRIFWSVPAAKADLNRLADGEGTLSLPAIAGTTGTDVLVRVEVPPGFAPKSDQVDTNSSTVKDPLVPLSRTDWYRAQWEQALVCLQSLRSVGEPTAAGAGALAEHFLQDAASWQRLARQSLRSLPAGQAADESREQEDDADDLQHPLRDPETVGWFLKNSERQSELMRELRRLGMLARLRPVEPASDADESPPQRDTVSYWRGTGPVERLAFQHSAPVKVQGSSVRRYMPLWLGAVGVLAIVVSPWSGILRAMWPLLALAAGLVWLAGGEVHFLGLLMIALGALGILSRWIGIDIVPATPSSHS